MSGSSFLDFARRVQSQKLRAQAQANPSPLTLQERIICLDRLGHKHMEALAAGVGGRPIDLSADISGTPPGVSTGVFVGADGQSFVPSARVPPSDPAKAIQVRLPLEDAPDPIPPMPTIGGPFTGDLEKVVHLDFPCVSGPAPELSFAVTSLWPLTYAVGSCVCGDGYPNECRVFFVRSDRVSHFVYGSPTHWCFHAELSDPSVPEFVRARLPRVTSVEVRDELARHLLSAFSRDFAWVNGEFVPAMPLVESNMPAPGSSALIPWYERIVHMIAEGVTTARALRRLAKVHAIDSLMPIIFFTLRSGGSGMSGARRAIETVRHHFVVSGSLALPLRVHLPEFSDLSRLSWALLMKSHNFLVKPDEMCESRGFLMPMDGAPVLPENHTKCTPVQSQLELTCGYSASVPVFRWTNGPAPPDNENFVVVRVRGGKLVSRVFPSSADERDTIFASREYSAFDFFSRHISMVLDATDGEYLFPYYYGRDLTSLLEACMVTQVRTYRYGWRPLAMGLPLWYDHISPVILYGTGDTSAPFRPGLDRRANDYVSVGQAYARGPFIRGDPNGIMQYQCTQPFSYDAEYSSYEPVTSCPRNECYARRMRPLAGGHGLPWAFGPAEAWPPARRLTFDHIPAAGLDPSWIWDDGDYPL